MAVFPEQVVGGYPTEDLIQWRGFVASQRAELERFAAQTSSLGTVFALGLTVGLGGDLFNSAALVHAGRIVLFCPKEKLPTYNIFYESRTFSRGVPYLELDADGVLLGDRLVAFDFGTVALDVCEDLWSPDGPMRRRCYSGAELVLNLSASPFRAGIADTRREMLATRAADNQATVVYSNLVGGNDGLVFDGGGLVNQNGRPMLEAPRFCEGYAAAVVDLDRTTRCRREASTWRRDCEAYRATERLVPTVRVTEPGADRSRLRYPVPMGYHPEQRAAGAEPPSFFLPPSSAVSVPARDALLDDFYEALALGVADYFRKTGAFRLFGVATSGGRDSCLSLLVAWRAVQLLHPGLTGASLRGKVAELVSAFYMPTRFSSDSTRAAAERLVGELGARFVVLPIEEAFARELAATEAMLGPDGPPPTSLTRQNVQARVRGGRMW